MRSEEEIRKQLKYLSSYDEGLMKGANKELVGAIKFGKWVLNDKEEK